MGVAEGPMAQNPCRSRRHAGPMDGNYFLVIIDAHNKWGDIYKTKGTTDLFGLTDYRILMFFYSKVCIFM